MESKTASHETFPAADGLIELSLDQLARVAGGLQGSGEDLPKES